MKQLGSFSETRMAGNVYVSDEAVQIKGNL
jgi:hypothetical protein